MADAATLDPKDTNWRLIVLYAFYTTGYASGPFIGSSLVFAINPCVLEMILISIFLRKRLRHNEEAPPSWLCTINWPGTVLLIVGVA